MEMSPVFKDVAKPGLPTHRFSGMPKVLRTIRWAMPSNSRRFSRHILAASTFAPLSSLGSENNEKSVIKPSLTLFNNGYYTKPLF